MNKEKRALNTTFQYLFSRCSSSKEVEKSQEYDLYQWNYKFPKQPDKSVGLQQFTDSLWVLCIVNVLNRPLLFICVHCTG